MKARSAALILKSLFALICLFNCSTALATTVRMPSDEELILGARAIIRGRVLAVGSAPDGENEARIYTYTVVRVQEVLKGDLNERRIVIKEEGGQVGARGSLIWGAPQFTAGEQVILYLTTRRDGSLRIHQMFLGKFNILDDPTTGRAIVSRSPIGENVSVINTQSVSGGQTESTEFGELGAYTAMVRQKVRASRERFERFERQHFADIPLRAQPAEYASLASQDAIQPQFTFIRSAPIVRWFEPDDNQPIVFTINPDGAPNAQAMEDVTAAMNAWSTVPGCPLRVINGGPTTLCIPHGVGNTIVFNNCDDRFSPTPDCSSLIAIGGVNWDSSQTRVINGVTFAKVYQGHITFNPYSACSFERHCDIQEIATHELGHALGLGHSRDITATMAGTAHFDGRCATLRQDDVYGIKFLYPASASGETFLHITTGALPDGYLATLFEQQLEAAGGVTPFTWTRPGGAGSLPPGFVLLPSGLIRGTPVETGSWTFTVKVTDVANVTAQKTFTINVLQSQPPFDSQFVTQNMPTTVQAGQSFEANVKWRNIGAQGWAGATGFRLISQNPANNTTWGGDTVTLAGYNVAPGQQLDLTFTARAPQTNGTYNFQWRLYQDGPGFFGQASVNVQITVTGGANPMSIDGPSSLDILAGTSFNHQLTATGGTAPYHWSISGGALPAGLALNPATGLISGVPAAAGNFSFVVQVADSESRAAQRSLTINITAPPQPQFAIATASLPAGSVGASYNASFTATGGAPPYNWSLSTGSLPAGVTLNAGTGALTGTPTVAGSHSFVIQVTDASSRAAQRAFTLVISPPPVAIATTSLPTVAARSTYHAQLAATGGAPPYTWSVPAGALPAGLSLGATNGVITGTPTGIGDVSFTVEVKDSLGGSARKQLVITVLPAPLAIERASAQLEGTQGAAFSYQVNVTGGAPPYTWSISGGALPAGLALNPATGLVSGVPAASGTFTVTVNVRDQKPETVSASIQLRIIDPQTIPRVTSAKYKIGKRILQVFGERIAPDATLLIDGAPVTAKYNDGVLVVKRLILTPGSHQIIVLNSLGIPSQPFVIEVLQV